MIKELVKDIATALVDDEEAVNVHFVDGEHTVIIELTVGKPDVGKVIGRQGRIADAIRTIVGAAAAKTQKRYVLQILDGR